MSVSLKKQAEGWRRADVQFYQSHGSEYAGNTFGIDLTAIHDRFLSYVPTGGLILDVGSGSGRDTLAFLRRGYRVEALEPSSVLAAISVKLTGISPRVIRVQDLDYVNRYDGIWACASLVHVPPDELQDVFRRLISAAKRSAPIYCSFKYGHGPRVASDGRPYTDLTEVEFCQILSAFPNIERCETWKSDGEGSAHGLDVWLNAIFSRA